MVVSAALLLSVVLGGAPQTKPNVLILFVDDMGWQVEYPLSPIPFLFRLPEVKWWLASRIRGNQERGRPGAPVSQTPSPESPVISPCACPYAATFEPPEHIDNTDNNN